MSEGMNNRGKITGQGTITRKDGTVEHFVLNSELTKEESDQLEANLLQSRMESENQNKIQE